MTAGCRLLSSSFQGNVPVLRRSRSPWRMCCVYDDVPASAPGQPGSRWGWSACPRSAELQANETVTTTKKKKNS
eukprot:7286706-Prymnesium_polylepis.1